MGYKIIAKGQDKDIRLDKVISRFHSNISRSYIQFLIKKNKVTVNKNIENKSSFKIKEDDIIEWKDFKRKTYIKNQEKLNIVYQDSDLLIIEKPAGIVVHPMETLKPRNEVTILDILVNEFPEIKKIKGTRPGIVHRLDKYTSGLLMIAKNKKSFGFLKSQFKKRKVKKVYLTLISGRLEPKEGTIDAPIGRSPKNSSKMAVASENEGRVSVTDYKVLEYLPLGKDMYTLVLVFPITGRTHQIRVHFSSIGHPIIGDRIYGARKPKEDLARPFLHAIFLGFKLPSGEFKEFRSDLPKDLNSFLNDLRCIN